MRYLIEDYKNKQGDGEPTIRIVDEDTLFSILQEKTEGIAVSKLPDVCLIDWS